MAATAAGQRRDTINARAASMCIGWCTWQPSCLAHTASVASLLTPPTTRFSKAHEDGMLQGGSMSYTYAKRATLQNVPNFTKKHYKSIATKRAMWDPMAAGTRGHRHFKDM